MDKNILSLKSLYNVLFKNDYPVYSLGVIRKSNRKGITLIPFWRENILIDFRNRKYGKIIWRVTGSRNRYLSDICNRSDRLHMYREYAEEIGAAVTEETVLRQIRHFMVMLQERQFHYEEFCKKMEAWIPLLAEEDEHFSVEAEAFFGGGGGVFQGGIGLSGSVCQSGQRKAELLL